MSRRYNTCGYGNDWDGGYGMAGKPDKEDKKEPTVSDNITSVIICWNRCTCIKTCEANAKAKGQS